MQASDAKRFPAVAEHHVMRATLHNCPIHESGVVDINEPVLLGPQKMRVLGYSLDLTMRQYESVTLVDAEPLVMPWGQVVERWP